MWAATAAEYSLLRELGKRLHIKRCVAAMLCSIALALTVAVAPGRATVAAAAVTSDPQLESLLLARIADADGTFGVAIKDLTSGRSAYINPDEVFETASLFKLFVMVELFHQQHEGRLSLASEPWLASWLEAMITVSDNAAAESLYMRLGINNINATMRQLGLPHNQVAWESTTTPREMGYLLERIALLRVVDEESSAGMIRLLARQQVNDRIPRRLPAGTYVAHKTGDLNAMTHDAGVVYGPRGPFVMVILCRETYDVYTTREVQADLARIAYDYFEQAPPVRGPSPPLMFDPWLDALVRESLPAGFGVAVKNLTTGQGALVGTEGEWPEGAPGGPWPGVARGTLATLQWLSAATSPNADGHWQGLEVGTGNPTAAGLAGGVPPDVPLASHLDFDGYSAFDAALVFSAQGPYAIAIVARGDEGSELPDLSRRIYEYVNRGAWAAIRPDRIGYAAEGQPLQ